MLSHKHILVVEDEVLLALAITDFLLDADATVIGPAGSVDGAIDLIQTEMKLGGIDAAVLDINLCGEMVWPVAELLGELGVPFAFHTAYDNLVLDSNQIVLSKPCSLELIVDAMHQVIALKAAQASCPSV